MFGPADGAGEEEGPRLGCKGIRVILGRLPCVWTPSTREVCACEGTVVGEGVGGGIDCYGALSMMFESTAGMVFVPFPVGVWIDACVNLNKESIKR